MKRRAGQNEGLTPPGRARERLDIKENKWARLNKPIENFENNVE